MRAFLVSALLLPTVWAFSRISPQLEDSIAHGEISVCPGKKPWSKLCQGPISDHRLEGVDGQDCIKALDSIDKEGKDEIPFELEEKLSELDQLHEQLFALEDQVWKKESEIAEILELKNDEDNSASRKHLKEELAECDSLKCVLDAIFERAHLKLRKIKIFLRKHHPHHRHHRHHRHGRCGPPKDRDGPSPPPHHRGPHRGGPPEGGHSFGDRFHRYHHRHHYKGPLFLLLGIVFLVITTMVYGRRCCCNPRLVADRIAARIERRNARMRRRAERREKVRSWVKSFVTGCSSASGQDFQSWCKSMLPCRFSEPREKSSMVVEQEVLLHEHMQAEIQELRNATSVVDSLVSAEEGHSSFNSERDTRGRGRGRWSSSLPRYRNQSGPSELGPPPDYESEVNATVVDGFQYDPDMIVYTPSASEKTSSESSSEPATANTRWKN
jgi:hypothetical protein